VKRRLPLLVLLASLAFPAAAPGDGCPPLTCGTSSSYAPGSGTLFVRPSGSGGPLVLYDLVSRKRTHALPGGLLSADGTRFVVSRTTKSQTSIVRYAVPSGRLLSATRLHRQYQLSAVSARGDRQVFVDSRTRGVTRFAIADGRSRILRRFSLRGNYGVETLSPDSRRVFLVRYRRNGYDLNIYDLGTRRLTATPLAGEPGEPGEKMSGTAWGGIASRDGRWLLTLYLKPAGTGFIHALDLRTGIGHCVDLDYGDFQTLGNSALVLSPDLRTLYVASPLVGRVTTIDLRRPRVVASTRFPSIAQNDFLFGVGPSGAVSPNGRMLYVTAGSVLVAYDTAFQRVRGPFRIAPRPTVHRNSGVAAAIGFEPGGRRVVVLRLDRRMVALDAATGRMVR
jgi:DNA-binding beta-propeller fold protein YncE